jgi:hypothetical protein
MSQLNAADIQTQVVWNKCVELVAFVVLLYDYLLTLDLEVERFWKRETIGLTSILFFVNRYLTLLGNIPIAVVFFWSEPVLRHNRCHVLETYQQLFLSLVQLFISIAFILRVYALYDASRRIAVFLCVVAAAMIGNGLLQWRLSDKASALGVVMSGAVSGQVGCIQSYTTAQGLHMVYLWLGVLILDICIFSLTLWKAFMMRREAGLGGIMKVVMLDGAMYFGIITLINSANILCFSLGMNFIKGLLPIFANVMASVLMSHLMFNLRKGQTTEKTEPSELAIHVIELSQIGILSSLNDGEISSNQFV